MPSRYDVIVVGAGPAGGATAMLLGRAGLDVLVVHNADDGAAPTTTATLMGGVAHLQRWGLLERVSRGAPPLSRTESVYGDGVVEPAEDLTVDYSPRRDLFVSALRDAAGQAGAQIRAGSRVQNVLRNFRGRVVGVEWIDESTGEPQWAHAPLIVGADGRESTVATAVGARVRHTGTSHAAVVSRMWSGFGGGVHRRYWRVGVSAGVIPTNDGQVCIWAGVPSARFADDRGGVLGPYYQYKLLAEAAPELDLEAGSPRGPVRRYAGGPGFVRASSGPGWALVGDAGLFTDPITDHGVTAALRDAELLSRAVRCAGRDTDRLDAGLSEYEAMRDRLAQPVFRLTDRIASYDWTCAHLRELRRELAVARSREAAFLTGLDAFARAA